MLKSLSWWPVVVWAGLSVWVICILLAGLRKRRRREKELQELVSRLLRDYGYTSEAKQAEAELEQVRLAIEQNRRDTTQQLVGVALLMAAAFGMACRRTGRPPPLPITAR